MIANGIPTIHPMPICPRCKKAHPKQPDIGFHTQPMIEVDGVLYCGPCGNELKKKK